MNPKYNLIVLAILFLLSLIMMAFALSWSGMQVTPENARECSVVDEPVKTANVSTEPEISEMSAESGGIEGLLSELRERD